MLQPIHLNTYPINLLTKISVTIRAGRNIRAEKFNLEVVGLNRGNSDSTNVCNYLCFMLSYGMTPVEKCLKYCLGSMST